MFFSTDGGVNWVNTDSSANLSLLHPLLLHPLNDVFLIGTEAAIAVGDSGDILFTPYVVGSWIEQESGTDSCLNGVFFVDDLTGWVVGDGGTILHTTNGDLTLVEGERRDQVPTEFVLSQNFPNPFNPSTTIRYALPHTSFVTLTVYNILGQEVAQLVKEQQQAGYHDAVFRGDGLASGVYFYRLEAGGFVEIKKLALLR
jgi:hypothetical protein